MNVRPVRCTESQRTAVARGSSWTCCAELLFELQPVNIRKQWPNCTQHRRRSCDEHGPSRLTGCWTDWLAVRLTDTHTNLLIDENNAYETNLIIYVCLGQNQGQRQICCSVWVTGGSPCTRVGPAIFTKYTEYFLLVPWSTCETWRYGQ